MSEADFKKLLIDLGMRQRDVARAIGISDWGVQRYFRGELRNPARRRQIKRVLARRARQCGVALPDFWPDVPIKTS